MPKLLLTIKAECIAKNERKNGGNVLFAIDVQIADNKTATARKTLNYQTTDLVELAGFKTSKEYTITITE
jgi:hypothetical protein